jgi:lactate dehydrogenase-like 2-hydroxyacid dehydrogenase
MVRGCLLPRIPSARVYACNSRLATRSLISGVPYRHLCRHLFANRVKSLGAGKSPAREGRRNLSKAILVVLGQFTEDVEGRIARDFTVRRVSSDAPTRYEDVLRAAEGADALFISPVVKLDAEFFRRVAASVKVIATFSVGYDHIDLRAAAARNMPIANTPGVLTDATADLAMLLLLGASRRAYEAEQLVRTGAWAKMSSAARLLGWDCAGKVLGIFGMGRIGQAVARRARAFGMKIHYYNRNPLTQELAGDAVFHESAQGLLRVSQFLSLHAPHTPETHHFLNAQNIALLPAGAIVINSARGGLVEDEALIAALKTGRVAAAGLDVFEGEPNINPGYIQLQNTFLLPHIGSATLETNTAMGMLALDNIDAVLAGKPAPSLLKL